MRKITRSCLTVGAGKANATLQWITKSPAVDSSTENMPNSPCTVYVAARDEVESLDTRRFLLTFGPLIGREDLQMRHRKVHFTISGFDGIDDEIYEIAAVRNYYACLHQILPCWLFYAHLASAGLLAVMLSILPNLVVIRSKQGIAVEVANADVHSFFMDSLPAAALLHSCAGISKRSGIRQLAMSAKYLGIHKK